MKHSRHTFGADLARAGISFGRSHRSQGMPKQKVSSLPALQHLMGHAQIRTTMLYVQLAPQDVWREYARAIEKRTKLDSSPS
jgi:integrase